MKETIQVSICKGCGCYYITINDWRLCGPKPYGGGTVLATFKVSPNDFQKVLDDFKKGQSL